MDCDDGPFGSCTFFVKCAAAGAAVWCEWGRRDIRLPVLISGVRKGKWTQDAVVVQNLYRFFGKNLMPYPLSLDENCDIITPNEEIRCYTMNIETVTIEQGDVHRLLAAASGDAALLYLYIRIGIALIYKITIQA